MNEHQPLTGTAEEIAKRLFDFQPCSVNPEEHQAVENLLICLPVMEIYKAGFIIGATTMLNAISKRAITEIGKG